MPLLNHIWHHWHFCSVTQVRKTRLSRIHQWTRDCHELRSVEKSVIKWWRKNYSPHLPEIHHLEISNWSKLNQKTEKHPHIPSAARISCFVLFCSMWWIQILLQPLIQYHHSLFVVLEWESCPSATVSTGGGMVPRRVRGFLGISEAGDRLRAARAAGRCVSQDIQSPIT